MHSFSSVARSQDNRGNSMRHRKYDARYISGSFPTTPTSVPSISDYVQVTVKHDNGSTWEAGYAAGVVTDDVGLGSPMGNGVLWSNSTVQFSGFVGNYGATSAGAVENVVPGDSITLKVFDPASGLSDQTSINVPLATNVEATARDLTSGLPPLGLMFAGDNGQIEGTVDGPGACSAQGVPVSATASSGSLTQSAVSGAFGTFALGFTAPTVAGPLTVTFSKPATSTLTVPILPTVNTIASAIGPVSGGVPVTLTGMGFASGVQVSFGGSAATVQGSSSDHSEVFVTPPPSPINSSPDHDGAVSVVAKMNNEESPPIGYEYVVPGKPYFTLGGGPECGVATLTVNIYSALGIPLPNIPVQLSAAYPAFGGQTSASLNTDQSLDVGVGIINFSVNGFKVLCS